MFAIRVYETLASISYPPSKEFGLDNTDVTEEFVPLKIHLQKELTLHRKEGFD